LKHKAPISKNYIHKNYSVKKFDRESTIFLRTYK